MTRRTQEEVGGPEWARDHARALRQAFVVLKKLDREFTRRKPRTAREEKKFVDDFLLSLSKDEFRSLCRAGVLPR